MSTTKPTTLPESWPASNSELRSIDSLVPHARNARTHTKAQIAKIAASIREWGWTNPVLVDERNTIIAGHGRVLAAELEGIETVPVLVARGWTEAQRRAYVIADNRLALDAGWDLELLTLELGELRDLDFDLNLTGFEVLEIDKMFGEDSLARADAAVVPSPQKLAISIEGDRWILGRHILLCGDSSDVDVWDGVEAQMVWSDPPYGVSYVGKTNDALRIENDDIADESFGKMLSSVFGLIVSHSVKGAPWYIATPSGPNFIKFASVLSALNVWRQTLVWVKNVFVMGHSDFHYRHELMFYGWTPGGTHCFYGDRKQDTVWEIDRPQRSRHHPTMKPLPLIARSLELSSREGDLVVDPFGGSGSTMMACEALDRRCFSMEIDPIYVDVAVRRWQEHTGEAAVLDGDGRTFAAIEGGGR